jgi:transposase-like protein
LTELTEPLFDEQSIEILCARCHRTSPKTIAWIRANDRYRCPGCETEVVIERETLLRGVQLSRTCGKMSGGDRGCID